MIKILHVVDSLWVGGLENGLVNLIVRSDSSRFEHVICAVRELGPMADRLRENSVRVLCLNQKGGRYSVQIGPLARCIGQVKPDIIHSRNWGAIEAVMAARWMGSSAVIHSEYGLDIRSYNGEPLRRNLFRRVAFELAHRVFAVSSHLRDLIAHRTGFPARRIGVIHDGVDNQRFLTDGLARSQCRKELGISNEEFCIGSIGRLDPIKDHPTLLRAVEQFSKSCPNWRLLIIGDGPELSKLQAFVNEHPILQKRVHFLGRTNEVPRILNALDAYVLHSVSEEISNSLLEAMATGLPVVATMSGGTPEVIAHGKSGWMFPVGDYFQLAEYLGILYRQIEQRKNLGQEAIRCVSDKFSMQKTVQQYGKLYDSVVESASTRD